MNSNLIRGDIGQLAANGQPVTLRNCDLHGAGIGGVKLTAAKRFKGAIISKQKAADLLGQLGLHLI